MIILGGGEGTGTYGYFHDFSLSLLVAPLITQPVSSVR